MPSFTLLTQSVLSGLFVGSLYSLLGLGMSLSWRFLSIINLAHFGFVSLSAYLTYQLIETIGLNPLVAVLLFVPLFFAIGSLFQYALMRFKVGEFASLLVTFGVMIVIETFIQWIWTADFRKVDSSYATLSVSVGPVYIPLVEAAMFAVATAFMIGMWGWLRFSYLGKALRATADDADMAASFGVDHQRLGLLVAGIGTASGAVAGVVFALISTLAPSQIGGWLGVVFATVILGGLGNPLGLLLAGIGIGVSEALTMALIEPTWGPLVSFTLLVLILILRPERI
jgi:branched-chain amino acid transport system permease protein